MNRLYILKQFRRTISWGLALTCLNLLQWSYSNAAGAQHEQVIEEINYILSMDRLDYYVKSLAEHLKGKKSDELVQSLKDLRIEDYRNQKFSHIELSDPASWDQVLEKVIRHKDPQVLFTVEDLRWDYNFFKNKLISRFKTQKTKIDYASLTTESEYANSKAYAVASSSTAPITNQSLPKSYGKEPLLDHEHYISEKTTRAIIWDAILNHKDFIFQIGTQKDFNDFIRNNNLQVVTEVIPYSRNYNKIFLIYDSKTEKYSYVVNLISGQDRVKHLMTQLRLIKIDEKTFVNQMLKVNVVGNSNKLHLEQQEKLTLLLRRLPKADKVILGQKRAFEEFILNQYPQAKPQFNIEMPSHEFSDYLLEDKNGQIKRWRFFSAVWGDEVVPIAKSLSESGHKQIIYIGTAGALATSGLKIGDLVAGREVYSKVSGNQRFASDDLNLNLKSVRVGQVYSPFEETDQWLKENKNHIDIVEVETGYLLKNVSQEVKVQGYFLISDIVGSESDSIAQAGKSSSRRKKSQQLLIKTIFESEKIETAIGSYELIPYYFDISKSLQTIKKMRSSREPLSQVHLAYVLGKSQNYKTDQIEKMIKANPTFNRLELTELFRSIENYLFELSSRLGKKHKIWFSSEQVLDGTINPHSETQLQIMVRDLKAVDVQKLLGPSFQDKWNQILGHKVSIQLEDGNHKSVDMAVNYNPQKPDNFIKYYEKNVILPTGHMLEIDLMGQLRLKKASGVEAFKCESLFGK